MSDENGTKLRQAKGWHPTSLIMALATCVGAVAVFAAVLFASLASNLIPIFFKITTEEYGIALVIVFIICVILFITTVAIAANFFVKNRNKEIIQLIKDQPEVCRNIQNELVPLKQTVAHLHSIVANSELNKSVLDNTEVCKLEASVKKDKHIIIYTSKFILEGNNEFTKIIIRNFRKGVKYIYYIPNDKLVVQKNYWARVADWYKGFSSFIKSKESAEALIRLSEKDKENGHEWNSEYLELIQQYLSTCSGRSKSKNNSTLAIEEELKNMFTSQLETHTLDINLFFITVAMYEQEINVWRAIIKLPTEKPKENFVAFSLDHSDINERETFINSILRLEDPKTILQFQQSIFKI